MEASRKTAQIERRTNLNWVLVRATSDSHLRSVETPMPTTTTVASGPHRSVRVGTAQVDLGNALALYGSWPSPTTIVVDGPYGVGGFPGDPPTPHELATWYAPHAAEWAQHSLPETTLWFWGTEVGWATVHPVLDLHGWEYRGLHIWDKGVAHVAGNVNGRTIRGFPIVTEVCARYVRRVEFEGEDGEVLTMRQWLRAEWVRSGLPLYRTNEACGVANAATRKYFTQDHVWYFPPAPMMGLLAAYAQKHGRETTRPYFSLDGCSPLDAEQWSRMRAKWHHTHGVTNVWRENAVRGAERLKKGRTRALHANQKPLALMERMVLASSDPGDVIWEPFGGLCTGALAAARHARPSYSAEIAPDFFDEAVGRLNDELSIARVADA